MPRLSPRSVTSPVSWFTHVKFGSDSCSTRLRRAKRPGHTVAGNGFRYRGRGLIQITGRANYAACGDALGVDLLSQPELLEQPQYACMSAARLWGTKGLNTLADAGDFERITRRINGGLNGQDDRLALWKKAGEVLA